MFFTDIFKIRLFTLALPVLMPSGGVTVYPVTHPFLLGGNLREIVFKLLKLLKAAKALTPSSASNILGYAFCLVLVKIFLFWWYVLVLSMFLACNLSIFHACSFFDVSLFIMSYKSSVLQTSSVCEH